jgi:hypothetical protein
MNANVAFNTILFRSNCLYAEEFGARLVLRVGLEKLNNREKLLDEPKSAHTVGDYIEGLNGRLLSAHRRIIILFCGHAPRSKLAAWKIIRILSDYKRMVDIPIKY